MDDFSFIIWIAFWVGLNSIVGYVIGQRKNDVAGCMALSILLGPIGWLIATLWPGNLRKCPFCSEEIKPDARVCRYCGRDLPTPVTSLKSTPTRVAVPETVPVPAFVSKMRLRRTGIWTLVSIGVALVILVPVGICLAKDDSKIPRSSFNGVVEETPSQQFVTITQPISIGVGVIPAGSRLELVSREGSEVHVRYEEAVYGIPISATDLK